ncbi:hypothetical protein TNCV_2029401 [Trichonephila clavipes]|nr:hypothetical protein TNCV_2029401 [Trichonephila clavipes]
MRGPLIDLNAHVQRKWGDHNHERRSWKSKIERLMQEKRQVEAQSLDADVNATTGAAILDAVKAVTIGKRWVRLAIDGTLTTIYVGT